MTEFINAQEAAEIIGVRASTITRWLQAGEMPGKKGGETGKEWLLSREVVEAKAAVYERPLPVPLPQSFINLNGKKSPPPGLVNDATRARAKETVIGRWAEAMPEAAARHWFSVLLEGGN